MIEFLVLLSVPAMFFIGLRRPHRALLLWLLLSPLSQDRMVVFGAELHFVTFDRLAFLATVLSLLVNGQLRNVLPIKYTKLEKATFIFMLTFLLEGVLTIHPSVAINACIQAVDWIIIPFYLYFFVKYLLTRSGAYDDILERQILFTMSFVGIYCAIMSIYEGITLDDLFPTRHVSLGWIDGLRSGSAVPRTNGPFYQPEILGQYLSVLLLMFLYRWRASRVSKIGSRMVSTAFAILYTLSMLIGMYFNEFRSIWVGFLGGYSIRYLLTRRGRGVFILGLLFLFLVTVVNWEALTKTEVYQKRITNTATFYSRVSAWLYAFWAFSEHPLTGIGFNELHLFIYRAQDRGDDLRFMDIPAASSPHNSLIYMLAEHGLLVTVPFCFLVCYAIGQARACHRLAQSSTDIEFGIFALSAIFALLVPQLFDRFYSWPKFENLLFLTIALSAARHANLVASVVPNVRQVTGLSETFIPEVSCSLPF